MARSLIGLDVGTNAVTVAEVVQGTAPKLTAFGQVALTREAMRDGEVIETELVAAAIKRLREEVGLRRGGVRVGVSSPRLIVRQVEMPVMSQSDLASALRFQAADLIPFPLADAVIDFAILDQDHSPTGEPVMRVLLAAAQKSMVDKLIEAVEIAGLSVDAVDLVPLALIRALGPSTGIVGAEAIVSIGGGTCCVVVHDAGIPRFVRVLGSGGRDLTDAIASMLALAPDAAESLKRQIGTEGAPIIAEGQAAIERPLAALLDEIRGSIDYYRNQPGVTPLSRVFITGGTAQLAGLTDRLSDLLGIEVQVADVRSRLAIADIGFAPEELPRLDPYLAAAVGLAIVDPTRGPAMNLLAGREREKAKSDGRAKYLISGLVAAAAVGVGLAYPVMQRNNAADEHKREAEAINAANLVLQTRLASPEFADLTATELQLSTLRSQIAGALGSDVSWPTLLHEIATAMPNDVWLTSFNGQVAPTSVVGSTDSTGATSSTLAQPGQVGVEPGAISGTVSFEAVGLDFPSVAAWIDQIHSVMKLQGLWVPDASRGLLGEDVKVVNFTSSASLTANARSDRADEFAEDQRP